MIDNTFVHLHLHTEYSLVDSTVRIGELMARCSEAEGMTAKESRNLIEFLYAHSQNIYAMYRHRWQPGDVVIWDNRCTLHAGVYDHAGQTRVLHRVMCRGERPF